MFTVSSRITLSFAPAFLLAALCVLFTPDRSHAEGPDNWWKPEWSARKKITINTGDDGFPIDTPPGDVVVLLRLAADFPIGAKDDGSDVRFVTADNKTELPYHFERWESLFNEALVWVKVPDLQAGTATDIWMYYGNPGAQRVGDPRLTYDDATTGVYHFADNGAAPADSSPVGVNGEGIAVPVQNAIIGGGVRFTEQNELTIPGDPATGWTAGGALTLSIWAKAAVLSPEAVIYSRADAAGALVLGLDNGVPYVSVTDGAGTVRTPAAAPVDAGPWLHLAVTSSNGTITLYLNGESYGSVTASLPGIAGPMIIGRDAASANGFAGELDELTLANVARTPGFLSIAAANQGGTSAGDKLLVIGSTEAASAEGHSEIAEHLNLLKSISKSLTIDGWIVIYLCGLLAVIGWAVAVDKFFYLNKVASASKVFLKQWKAISTDITSLDHGDGESVENMGGKLSGQQRRQMKASPLFHLYHLGSQEIHHRISNAEEGNFKGLSERSIGSIRALLEGGATRETQKLQSKLVFLTIGIAGGPYLGLLGTVIGVMITFAIIAQSGEVNVNSIAPGIAGALLATVAGLVVAIPALFMYSYLASRIKDGILSMNAFIEEFIARIAEAYPSKD
jgi:biopolymer transport protein ExbB